MVIIPNWFLVQLLSQQIVWRTWRRSDFYYRKVWDCSLMVIGALGGVGTYDFWTWRWYWISDINRDRIIRLCARYWDSLLSHCCWAVSSYSLWYLVSDIWIWSIQILYMKDASFSCKILLKIIHFKSRNSGVTWSRFKYFPLLAT